MAETHRQSGAAPGLPEHPACHLPAQVTGHAKPIAGQGARSLKKWLSLCYDALSSFLEAGARSAAKAEPGVLHFRAR